MFTVLIVDDEAFVRNGLANHIQWAEHDVSIVRVAADGVSALEVADEIEPDLVLTDIRMPRMDGIEFAAELRARHPDAIIVFMSAYSDKEYLKSAIKLQVLGYIDKPVDLAEANAMIARAIERRRMKDPSPVEPRSKSIGRLIDGSLDDVDAIRLLQELGASSADNASFLVAIVERRHGEPDPTVALDAEVASLLSREGIVVAFGELPSVPCCAIVGRSERPTKAFSVGEQIAIDLALDATRANGDPCFVAIGRPVSGWRSLPGALESARAASAFRYVYGYGRTFRASPILEPDDRTSPHPPAPHDAATTLGVFADALDREDLDSLDRALAASADEVESQPSAVADPGAAHKVAYALMRCVDRFSERRAGAAMEPGWLAGGWDRLAAAPTYREATEIIGATAKETVHAVRASRGNSGVIDRVRHLIRENFHDPDLSIGRLSDAVEVSEAHLSVRYKKEVGTTIYASILEARMSRSKELLRNLSLPIQIVAMEVGYRDQTYFTKVFKRATGQTPTDFRKAFE